jgi:uncharacterized lipoprotein YddW (UPF0748 family)
MRHGRSRFLLFLPTFLLGLVAVSHLRAQEEVRALWVVRTSLTSQSSIATMVSAARAGGFNTLLVQIRGRADAFYASGLEPRAAVLGDQPAFDPLAETIASAHAAGLRVHAWVNVNLVAGVNELPAARTHVIYRHPEWLMVPRPLAEDLFSVEPHSPEYLGRLARFVRGQPSEVEGLYLSPLVPGASEYTLDIIGDIADRYQVDGVHLDYMRYPNDEFDYSREALAAFRRSVLGDLPLADQRRLDARAAQEPLIYALSFPERWRAFRVDGLTSLVGRIAHRIKASKPAVTVSVAVAPDPQEAVGRRLQNWRQWVEKGLVDVLCPMAYTTDAALFATQIAAARESAANLPLWAGIGAYRLSPTQIVDAVQTARRLRADGIILFSYDSLTGPSRGPEFLGQVGRAAFMP